MMATAPPQAREVTADDVFEVVRYFAKGTPSRDDPEVRFTPVCACMRVLSVCLDRTHQFNRNLVWGGSLARWGCWRV